MRRKSERAKASPSVKQSESVPRRTTRRNKKSPEKSINEEDSENSSDHGSNSENEVQEVATPKRAKRLSRAEKSATIDEVKERPTRAKRKTTVRSSETNEDDRTTTEITVSQPDPIAEIGDGNNDKIDDRGHDNGDNASAPDGGDKDTTCTVANAAMPDTNKVTEDTDGPNEKVEQSQNAANDAGDNAGDDTVKTTAESEVIPKEAGRAVDDDLPATSASSNNHKIERNDISKIEDAGRNKANNISEKSNDEIKSKKKLDADTVISTAAEVDKSNDGDDKLCAPTIILRDGVRKIDNTDDVEDKEKENSPKLNVPKPVRKRKWLSSKQSTIRKDEIAISSDSLNALIPNVKPVQLNDINLETNSEPEIEDASNEIDSESEDEKSITRTISLDSNRRSEERVVIVQPEAVSMFNPSGMSSARKVSIVPAESVGRPPSPPKHSPSCILYITNLVRPFTAVQLRGLLARTGKIVENGFWMDKIKSKCFVKFETEDEAVETRHALHGVQWPSSNPKCLNVDFGSESQMEKALESTNDDMRPTINLRDDKGHHPWDRTEGEREKNLLAEKPVREWDLGKKPDNRRGRDGDRDDKEHVRDTVRGALARDLDRGERDRSRRTDREKRRHSESLSPGRKFAKKDNEPPLKLLDDLFRKTKATPSIYWLPLTPEQIAVKQEARQKQLAEHQRRIDLLKKQRADREQQDRERRRRSRERNSRDRGRNDRRRY